MGHELSRRLVILSGPSCVGKSPLDKALAKFYPQQVAQSYPAPSRVTLRLFFGK